MKDILGQELSVGDSVVVVRKGYRDMVKAKIIALTSKFIRAEYPLHYGNNMEDYLVLPSSVVKYQ